MPDATAPQTTDPQTTEPGKVSSRRVYTGKIVHLDVDTVRFPDGYPIADMVRRAAAMRVNVEPLAPCYADPATAPPGLLLGYANLTESQIDAGVQVLARAAR